MNRRDQSISDVITTIGGLEHEQPLVSSRARSPFSAVQAIVQLAGGIIILDACFR